MQPRLVPVVLHLLLPRRVADNVFHPHSAGPTANRVEFDLVDSLAADIGAAEMDVLEIDAQADREKAFSMMGHDSRKIACRASPAGGERSDRWSLAAATMSRPPAFVLQ